jgi:integrase
MGINPAEERKTRQARRITLAQAFEDFKQARKNLKPKTVASYQYHLDKCFSDWLRKPITQITKTMVSQRHRDMGESGTKAFANGAFRVLEAVLNFAIYQYEDGKGEPVLSNNPVNVLNHTRAWYPSRRRMGVIKVRELGAWYQAVQALKAEDKLTSAWVIADYLSFVLFTGLRASEASQLRWEDVDLEERTLTLPDPKNRQPFTLPLSDIAMDVLAQRREMAVNAYVFPNRTGTGALYDPRKQMAHVTEQSGVTFTIHDLRRTFITIAESLDISGYTLKRLVNHKVSQDVTDGYIISDTERLHGPVQQIADFLKPHLGISHPCNVVPLANQNR